MKAQDHTPLVVAATGSGAAMTCFYGRGRRGKSKKPARWRSKRTGAARPFARRAFP